MMGATMGINSGSWAASFLPMFQAVPVERDFTLMVMGIIGILIALLAQTGAFFYWGGQLKQSVTNLQESKRDHDERISALEEHGSPIARTAATAIDKECDAVADLVRRLENHVAALSTAMVRTEGLERRAERIERRCSEIHPPAVGTQRLSEAR